MKAAVVPAAATVLAVLLFGTTYLAARPFRRRRTPRRQLVAGPAVGVVKVRPVGNGVRSHRWREYPAQHRSNNQVASYGRRLRAAVPNGIHRSGTPWAKLNDQRRRFTAAVRGGAA